MFREKAVEGYQVRKEDGKHSGGFVGPAEGVIHGVSRIL